MRKYSVISVIVICIIIAFYMLKANDNSSTTDSLNEINTANRTSIISENEWLNTANEYELVGIWQASP